MGVWCEPVRASEPGPNGRSWIRQNAKPSERLGLSPPASPEEAVARRRTLRAYRSSSYRAYAGYAKGPEWLTISAISDSRTNFNRPGRGGTRNCYCCGFAFALSLIDEAEGKTPFGFLEYVQSSPEDDFPAIVEFDRAVMKLRLEIIVERYAVTRQTLFDFVEFCGEFNLLLQGVATGDQVKRY